MPTFRSLLPPLLPLPLLLFFSSLAHAARAMLPASSSAAAFIIRARRKTISSLGGRARWCGAHPDGCRSGAPSPPSRAVLVSTRSAHANRVSAHLLRLRKD